MVLDTLKKISEWPNLVPTGISNNDSGYDLNVLQYCDSSEGLNEYLESSGMSDGLLMGHSVDGADEDAEGEDEDIETDLPVEIAPKAKHKWCDNEQDNKLFIKKLLVKKKKPTVPHAGKLAPAEPVVRKKARTGIEHFADITAH